MLLLLAILGGVLSAPSDEFGDIINHGEVTEKKLMNIVPSGYPVHKTIEPSDRVFYSSLPKLNSIDESNEHYTTLNRLIHQGVCAKGLTFNIYDDKMRDAAVALFRLFQIANEDDHIKLDNWAKIYLNKEIVVYALRLESLYGNELFSKDLMLPPFTFNPHYFVNSEAIAKVLQVFDDILSTGKLNSQISNIFNYYYTTPNSGNSITISANYSGWNLPKNSIEDELNYFKEDVFLNSYYLGLHLLHPFWMSNNELDEINPRHAEHYYYAHKRLMARYELEKLHLKNRTCTGRDESDYVPYLSYKNGLPFPTRSCIRRDWDDEQAFLKKIDIALKECISRGVIFMENGTKIDMTEDNYIDVLARLVRGNLDNIKTSKIIRNIFGYGGNRFPEDEYNPAPSLLHHPETALRDPVYWYLIQYMLKYFSEYLQTMEPYDLSEYEDEDIIIGDTDFKKMYTYFAYHSFSIDKAIFLKRTINPLDQSSKLPAHINVMQKKIKHNSFNLSFNVNSKSSDVKKVVVRLFLGPECRGNCSSEYSKFFELDTFEYTLQKGNNTITWSPKSLEKPSQLLTDSPFYRPDTEYLNIFKFPDTLLIPRGLEEGLNVTLFIMITSVDNSSISLIPCRYNEILPQFDTKPLGFPFHRQPEEFDDYATNYRFYNITIYHKKVYVPGMGYFSPHLY